MQLNGARILIECLIREGVNIIFGYPGGSVLDIYDELPQYGEQLRHVLVRHEQAAVHAADGYARATGKVGVCMATSGPGATNTVTGIATAYCDSIPMVIFTGQVPTGLIGNDAFQEVDIAGITRPCTKHNYVVKDVKDLAKVVRQAFYLARSGRPGPVLVDLPKNVLQGSAEFVWPEDVSLRSYNPTYRPNYAQIRKVVDALYNAERPLLFGGGGVIMSNASEEFRNLAKNLSIPVTCSLMGLGAFPCDHPQWLGMLGMHGTYAANKAVSNADLLIAVGVRFDDRVTGNPGCFGANAKIIHLEIDPAEIGKIVPADVPLVGDVKQTLPLLTGRIQARSHRAWIDEFRACDKIEYEKVIRRAVHPAEGRIRMGEAVAAVARAYDNDAVLVTDVGQQQMFAARYFGFRRSRSMVTSGGLGTMGFGLPAAIGAKLGAPDREVCLFAGDGGLQMTIQELGTIFQSQVAVKIVLLNNSFLGMVRQWQELFYDRRYSFTELKNPDFGLIARGNGIAYRCVERREELSDAIAEMQACRGAYLLEVRVEGEDNVFPMVPAGAPVAAIRLE